VKPLPLTHRAKKSLGQNFLHDRNVARKIVGELKVGPGDRVLEIGPGPGALTSLLLEAAPARLAVLEMDDNWSRELKRQWPELFVIQADALRFDWRRLRRQAGGPAPEDGPDGEGRGWKLIGNLPYNVASPIMWDAAATCPGLERAVFMIQKEVAQRLAAEPGTKAYGALGVWVQSFVHVRLAFTVPPTVFTPRPKVDSAVVVFTPRPEGENSFPARALDTLLKKCFQNRRKQIQGILRGCWSGDVAAVLERYGLGPASRPETLAPRAFQELANVLADVFEP
jgi:16S rRNA (adenine1518-N6/adenine1519-N6)-dimethyltransferase